MDTYINAHLHVRTLADILAFEQIPLAQRALPQSTYALLCQAAALAPERTALHYVAGAERLGEGTPISYALLLARLHQTANLLGDLGIGPRDVVSLLVPNTPQAQYLLWGGRRAASSTRLTFSWSRAK